MYSVTNNRKEYLLWATLESDDYTLLTPPNLPLSGEGQYSSLSNIVDQAEAARSRWRTKISWRYNWKVLTVRRWPTTSVLALPTIVAETTATTVEEIVANKELVADWTTWTGETLVNPNSLVAFEWPEEELSTLSWQKKLLVWLQAAYTETLTAQTDESVATILTTNATSESEVQAIAWNIVTTNIVWTSLTNTIQTEQATDSPCWNTTHLATKDFWSTDLVSFSEWQTACDAAKKTFTCNNWQYVDWQDYADTTTYKYTSCSVWTANDCIAWNITWTNASYSYTAISHSSTQTVSGTKTITNWTQTYDAVVSCSNGTTAIDSETQTQISCDLDYYSSDTTTCISVWNWYYSLFWSPDRVACTNYLDTLSRDYTYTSSWNWTDSCTAEYTDLCGIDLYEITNWTCSAVEVWNYSPANNNNQIQCTTKTENSTYTWTWNWTDSCTWTCNDHYTLNWNTCEADWRECSITNWVWQQIWDGADWWECSITACNTDYYNPWDNTCISVWTWYYSDATSVDRIACTNDPDTLSRDYTYTWSWNGTNACPTTLSELCWLDLYETSNGVCSAVGNWSYSAANNNTKFDCTTDPDTTSRDYTYVSDWDGTDSCLATYTDLCGVDMYETANGTCSAVGTWNYSPSVDNDTYACSNKPANSEYSWSGNGSNNCTWSCNIDYILEWTECIKKLYVEDVFSTYLYTGNGNSQTINNGIDLTKTLISSSTWGNKLIWTTDNYAKHIITDKDGNVFISARVNRNAFIAKFSADGSLLWQKELWSSVADDYWKGIWVDSVGNVYVLSKTWNWSGDILSLAKFNSSWSKQWDITTSWVSSIWESKLIVDSSGNSYIAVSDSRALYAWVQIFKVNSSGSISWKRHLTNSSWISTYIFALWIGFDKDWNLEIYWRNSASSNKSMIVKYDSLGNHISSIWYSELGSINNINYISDGKILISWKTIIKFDTSNQVVWKKTFDLWDSSKFEKIFAYSSDEIYLVGQRYTGTEYNGFLVKLNSLWEISYERHFTWSHSEFGDIYVDDLSINIAARWYDTDWRVLVYKLSKEYIENNTSWTIWSYNISSTSIFTQSDFLSTLTTETPLVSDNSSSINFSSGLSVNNSNLTENLSLIEKSNYEWGWMVWVKGRDFSSNHALASTETWVWVDLSTNSTTALNSEPLWLTSFNSNGFSVGSASNWNMWWSWTNYKLSSWTFRKTPKFFDVVKYTGDGISWRQIAHNLWVEPGMIIVKNINNSADLWVTYHRSLTDHSWYLRFNDTHAQAEHYWAIWNLKPTNSVFTIGSDGKINRDGDEYIAYIFAHDPSDDWVIQCGNYSGNEINPPIINLGWEPQYLLIKNTTLSTQHWIIQDTIRGINDNSLNWLTTNLWDSEWGYNDSSHTKLTSTGFTFTSRPNAAVNYNNSNYIYCAIRKPMKTPSSSSEVFAVDRPSASWTHTVDAGFPIDLSIVKSNLSWWANYVWARLTWSNNMSFVNNNAEWDVWYGFDNNSSAYIAWTWDYSSWISYLFKRAPGFFDVVTYSWDWISWRPVNHNLWIIPEMVIVKRRNSWETYPHWYVFSNHIKNSNDWIEKMLILNENYARNTCNNYLQTSSLSLDSSTIFTLKNSINASEWNFIAYLYATLPWISKVWSYTWDGWSQVIDAGFSSWAKYIMIKRTESTGDWYVWDSERWIVDWNDPHISLNTTAAEVTGDDSVDPDNSWFIVNQNSATNINVSGGKYIYYSISK